MTDWTNRLRSFHLMHFAVYLYVLICTHICFYVGVFYVCAFYVFYVCAFYVCLYVGGNG